MLDISYIAARRRELKLTQEQAAKLAKLGTRSHWSRIESGAKRNMELATLARMARVLKCSIGDLLAKW